MIVVDTNILAYAVMPSERTAVVLAVLQREPDWVAPRLWRSELRNVLATAQRAGQIGFDGAIAAFEAAERLVQDVDVEAWTKDCLDLAKRGGISAYDAEFVTVAEQMGLMLVTADQRVARSFPERTILLDELAATLSKAL